MLGHNTDGCPRYKYLYADSYRAALQKKKDFEGNIVRQSPKLPCREVMLFRETAALWLEDSREKWKPSSYVRYQNCLEKDILPQWGETPLRNLDQDDYDKLMAQLKGRLKGSSLDIINAALKGIVQYSLSNRYLDQPPFDHSRISAKGAEGRSDILSAEEMKAIIQYIDSHFTPVTLGILLALCQGIRLGELCALQWEDVDVQKGVLHIRKTLQRIQHLSPEPDGPKTILHLGAPKNGRERSIPLHPAMLAALRNNPMERPGKHYVIRDHRPMEPRSFSRHFKRILEQAEIRNLNFHALRHTFASRCVEAGMDVKALSEILGHSSVKITMDRYVHLSMQYKQSQLENLELPFFSNENRQKNGQA